MKFIFVAQICLLLVIILEAQQNTNECKIREHLIYEPVWNHWIGAYCYIYTNDVRLNERYNLTVAYVDFVDLNQTYAIPGITLNNTYIWYDYLNETSLYYIGKMFKTDNYFNLWKSCCQEGAECCSKSHEDMVANDPDFCSAIWDGWTCFSRAKVGTTEEKLCSKQVYSSLSDVCEANSQKYCLANGTWNQTTNYDDCLMAPILRFRHNFNVIALAVATVICFPAAAILFAFRKLRNNLPLIFHRNLITVIIIRNLLTITTKEIIILDALKSNNSNMVMDDNGVACRVLAFFENAAKNGMYACMLADGFYLHKLITRPFADDPNMLHMYAIVLALTFVPSLIWAIKRGASGGADCWMVDYSHDQWITDGFRIAILAINVMLLLHIIYVMFVTIRRGGNTSKKSASTMRATAFLLPLFGIHIIVISNRGIVPNNTCLAVNIYYYISYLLEGLQGVMVAILFCYMNAEVRGEIRNFLRIINLRFNSKFGKNEGIYSKKLSKRRATTTTICK